MHTLVAHAVGRRLLFHDWAEAALLWTHITRRVPDLRGLVLMPNHLHLDQLGDDPRPLDAALRAFAMARNARRGERGPVWAPRPPPRPLSGRQHTRRNLRYLHMNPTRAGLVGCPLGWPFSTHRDALGLSLAPVRGRVGDPVAFHRYVSADPSAQVEGTALPDHLLSTEQLSLGAIEGAVSELLRLPLAALRRRGPGRRLVVAAARALSPLGVPELARRLDLHPTSVARTPPADPRTAALVARLAADPRFPGLVSGDPRLGGWGRGRAEGR